MEMTLNRTTFDTTCTQGSLVIEGSSFQCFTLELPDKDGTPGYCIPQGRYPVVLSPSPKFENSANPLDWVHAAEMPHLQDIPGRSLIMIHWGNTSKDTEGCILVGQDESLDTIENSRAAFADLWDAIQEDARNNNCWITVTNAASVPDAASAAPGNSTI